MPGSPPINVAEPRQARRRSLTNSAIRSPAARAEPPRLRKPRFYSTAVPHCADSAWPNGVTSGRSDMASIAAFGQCPDQSWV